MRDDLDSRWHRRPRFVVLEAGFGAGESFLATWLAWRRDPQRCERLDVIVIEPHPVPREALATGSRDPVPASMADQLQRAWPPLTPGLHSLGFDAGRVRLLLAIGDVRRWLPELDAEVDHFALDRANTSGVDAAGHARGRIGTDASPGDAHLAKRLARLAAPGATLTLPWGGALLVGRLAAAGFEPQAASETDAHDAVIRARFAPRFTARPTAVRKASRDRGDPHAVIIGAGLAGCAAAWALAERGWRSTVIDRDARIASQASGNLAGLFHGTLNEPDGLHARFNRAAALAAREAVRVGIDRHGVAGATDGMLRLERALDVAAMRAVLHRLRLPADYVKALDAAQASAVAGIALPSPAWCFAGGGWVSPAGLARSFIERAGHAVTLRLGVDVHTLQRDRGGQRERWRFLDAAGRSLIEAHTVVLANAGDAMRLLGGPAWPVASMRGQLSHLGIEAAPFALPRVPLSGAGCLLPAIDGCAVFGATAQGGDADAGVRIADHRANLAQLERLLGRRVDLDPAMLQGRTAWRCTSGDRLPLIGPVPDAALARHVARVDQPRFVPRAPGLFMFTALGSRGITWSALGAQVLAASVTGATAPIEASLLEAVDQARFISRQARRGARG